MFWMRFYKRSAEPDPTFRSTLYATALEMARRGEEHGFAQWVVSERHGSDNGYLPTPIGLASGQQRGRVARGHAPSSTGGATGGALEMTGLGKECHGLPTLAESCCPPPGQPGAWEPGCTGEA